MPQASTRAPSPVPPAQTPTAIVPGPNGTPVPIPIPLNAHDVDVLRERVNELSGELSAANSRRNALAGQLRVARPGIDQTGIESRLSQLDGRILGIEADIQALGRALSAAPNGLSQTTSTGPSARYGPLSSNQITGISIVGIIFVAAPIVWAIAMAALRRGARAPAPQLPKDVADRLVHMEQGIEAIAVEVERIGEGQRFVTQLMSDRATRAALPEGIPRT